MSDVFEKLAALREKYPDDVERIQADEKRLSDLMKLQDFSQLEVTQDLLEHCRREIISARFKLATERKLTDEERIDLWHIIDARTWFVQLVSQDFESELAQMDQDFEIELSR